MKASQVFIFFFKASSGSKRSLASVHGRWLRRCFSTLYIANFDLNLLLPLLQKAHVFLLVWEISRAIPWDRLSGKGVGKAQCHPLVGQWPIPEATPGSLQSAEPAALPSWGLQCSWAKSTAPLEPLSAPPPSFGSHSQGLGDNMGLERSSPEGESWGGLG